MEIQLVGKNVAGNKVELWIRRHSENGLSKSRDGTEWTPIESIEEAGMDGLDAELHLLMPARMPHIRFGKDTKLIHILSQIVGLGDLETIAELAEGVCRALRREATRINNREMAPEKDNISGFATSIGQTDKEAVRELPSYAEVVADTRGLEDIEVFGKAMVGAIEDKKKQLVRDLGIEIPEEDTPEYKECKEELDNLPGQVQNAMNELEKPLIEIFPNSVGFNVPTEDDLSELERKLELFEKDAQAKVLEQLEWALEEKRDKRAQLMLVAAEYFPQGSNNCPVCTQDLESVPQIKEQLDRLRPLAGQTHLKQELDNLDLSLRNGLGQIVALMLREEGRKTLCGRILSDWCDLKERGFKGFLLEIAEKFDERVQNIAEETQVEEEIESVPLAEGYFKDFPAAFYELDQALHCAKKYIHLCKSVLEKAANISEKLGTLLTAPEAKDVEDSLSTRNSTNSHREFL